MKLNSIFKYSIRFFTLQALLTFLTIYYFDNFLVPSNDYRLQIDANLLEDKDRFYPFIAENFIKIDILIGIFIFTFLIFLYSTKFYTYVNELSFSLDKNFYDEYFSIFLTWNFTALIAFGSLAWMLIKLKLTPKFGSLPEILLTMVDKGI